MKQQNTEKYLVLLISAVFILLSGCDIFGTSENYSTFQNELLDEVNYVRTSPADYAETRLLSYYQAGTDNGAYLDIGSRDALGSLEIENRLCSAASKYAEYLADNNVFGHYEDGTPGERCEREGYSYYSGENIAAGSYSYLNGQEDAETAAIEFVLMWIIDEGVPGVGHRENIMNESHTHMGAGFVHNTSSDYINYAVQDFGREY